MEMCPTPIAGCIEIRSYIHKDERGQFVKTFHAPTFLSHGLIADFHEQFYSVSSAGVLRGMHFQAPPFDHAKLVYCVRGSVLDAVLDLRSGSPTYGQHVLFDLSAERGNSIYIESGLAHGFYSITEGSIVVYSTTAPHSPAHDKGIRWNSADISWPNNNPTVSQRDRSLPRLSEYISPFTYSKE